MKKLFLVVTIGTTLAFTACKGTKNHNLTTTPMADTPGSGAKMTDTPTQSRPDSVVRK
jgi:hypothetical protein